MTVPYSTAESDQKEENPESGTKGHGWWLRSYELSMESYLTMEGNGIPSFLATWTNLRTSC